MKLYDFLSKYAIKSSEYSHLAMGGGKWNFEKIYENTERRVYKDAKQEKKYEIKDKAFKND